MNGASFSHLSARQSHPSKAWSAAHSTLDADRGSTIVVRAKVLSLEWSQGVQKESEESVERKSVLLNTVPFGWCCVSGDVGRLLVQNPCSYY